MKKETIEFDFAVFKNEELAEELTGEIKLFKKQIKEAIEFVKEHPTGEIEDLPAAIYDSMVDAALIGANEVYPDFQEPESGYSFRLQQYIPLDLAVFLPEDVFQLLPEEVQDQLKEQLAAEQEEDEEFPEPCKENSLYLTIKQDFFNQIMEGSKKCEYREIKETTYKKYLAVDENGFPYYDPEKLKELPKYPEDLMFLWNDGVCPLIPKDDLYYLDLAVGYKKDRDTATVQIKDFSFEPIKFPNTDTVYRYDIDDEGHLEANPNGKLCIWQIVFHLGEVVKKNE